MTAFGALGSAALVRSACAGAKELCASATGCPFGRDFDLLAAILLSTMDCPSEHTSCLCDCLLISTAGND